MALNCVTRSIGRLFSLACLSLGLLASLLGLPGFSASAQAQSAEGSSFNEEVSEEDAGLQAAVLAAEDRRITEIRMVTSLARWQGKNWKTPYRLGTASGYTLVLTPRAAPYTVEDLLKLAPQTFLRMSDGSYLLTEHLVVLPRATLHLSTPGGLTLRLASGHAGFSTIISFGGELEIVGGKGAPVKIMGWDADKGTEDNLLTDGRAYIRAIGGQFRAEHANLSHLGFWSGRTGGLALTGTNRPDVGAIGPEGLDNEPGSRLLQDVTLEPAGDLPSHTAGPTLAYSVPGMNFVSSLLSNVTVSGNAFGLFASGANGLQVSDSSFTDNMLGGVVLHRNVTNGVINRTTSSRNGGDGFSLSRATSSIAISESTAEENERSGFRLTGRPLADGPSVVGASLQSYGNNSVSHSTVTNNGQYGIEVVGGFNIGLNNNRIDGHRMGIMVNGPARHISVTGNTLRNSAEHGVALVNGVSDAMVTGNVVQDSSTGVYLRDSTGQVTGNTVQSARSHGVSLVGLVGGSEVSFNILAGDGTSALDATRADGEVSRSTNNADGWNDTTPWFHAFRRLLQPMSALWAGIVTLLIISAVRGRRLGGTEVQQPYTDQAMRPAYVQLSPQAATELGGRLREPMGD